MGIYSINAHVTKMRPGIAVSMGRLENDLDGLALHGKLLS